MMYLAIYKNNEGKFGAVLVEADERSQAVKSFELNNPDSGLLSLDDKIYAPYYINNGMSVIKTDKEVNMTYMVTYKAKNSEYFSCVLVEAINEELAEKNFKVFKPDCEFISIREEGNPETYIKRGMSILNDDLFNSIVTKMDHITLDDEAVSNSFVVIAKVKNQRELSALELGCSVADATLLQEPLPDFPFFVTLDWDGSEYSIRAVETIDSINDPNSDVAYLYRSSKNRVNDIQRFVFSDEYFDFEDKLNQLIDAFPDEPKAQEQIINRLAYEFHYGNLKGDLSKHSDVRFDVDGVLNDHTLLTAYKRYFPATEYTFIIKCWKTKNDRDEGCSETHSFPDLLTAISTGLDFIKENEFIEIVAASDYFDDECTILYIGPDDINQDSYRLGSMIVAEFQHIESMKAKGYLPVDY